MLAMIRYGLVLLAAALGSVAIAAERAENPLGNGPQVVAEGRAAYNQSCTVCHGVDGTAGDRAPALAAARRYVRVTDAALFDAIVNGIPGTEMPPTGLSENDAWKVVAYIRSLRATAADFPPDGDIAQGSEIYWREAQCGQCHMIRGRGGWLGPDLTDLGDRLSVNRIREALTVANPHPSRGYEPVVVETTEGETIRGILKNKHNTSYQVLSEDGRLRLLTADEVKSIEYSDESSMPSDYDERLSEEEFRDLVAFLSRLSRSEPESNQ